MKNKDMKKQIEKLWKIRREGDFLDWSKIKNKL